MSDRHPYWLLHPRDHVAVASLLVAALSLVAGWWFFHGGQGGLVEIDRAEPLAARFEVDLNTADRIELMQLPGVGPKLAQRILDSRTNDGPFRDHDDLLRVRGIGTKILEKLQPYLSGGEREEGSEERKE